MANLMNPAARNQGTYDGPNPDKPVDILYPKHASQIGAELGSYSGYFLREFNLDGKIMSDFGSAAEQADPDFEPVAKGGLLKKKPKVKNMKRGGLASR